MSTDKNTPAPAEPTADQYLADTHEFILSLAPRCVAEMLVSNPVLHSLKHLNNFARHALHQAGHALGGLDPDTTPQAAAVDPGHRAALVAAMGCLDEGLRQNWHPDHTEQTTESLLLLACYWLLQAEVQMLDAAALAAAAGSTSGQIGLTH